LLEIKDLSKKVPDLSGRYFRLFTRYEIYPGNHSFVNNDTFQQWADTKNTINKVSGLVNDNFAPENAPLTEVTTVSSDPNATTTEAPFKLTRSEFNRILRRNLKGLVRLFNIELQDALKVSEVNYAQYRKNASLEVSKFL
jgi:hypothetical protein